jgi:hypothetical protein
VHHDLKSLHLLHSAVIDSAYFYGVENEPGHHASVRDVSEQVLGIRLPELHDSIQDARAALQAAAYICKHGTAPLITRSWSRPAGSELAGSESELGPNLLLHRIPSSCSEEHIKEMILTNTSICPAKILPVSRGTDGDTGKTTILFSSQLHADLAFDSIPGPNRPDKANRAQKRIYLKGGGYICIRKSV